MCQTRDFLKLLNLYPALAVKITCDASKMLLEAYDRLRKSCSRKSRRENSKSPP
ncbi:MAG: hypothetical protein Q9M89_04155 [Persephonella sp.]|nr:hypothetical protein [Persephonella sp.]